MFQSKSEYLKTSISIGFISCSLIYKNKEHDTNLYILQMQDLQNGQDVHMKEAGVVFYQKIMEMLIFFKQLI